MSTSPVPPEDIRAAAEVHRELGPEYDDAVVASFLDKVEREIAARVEARLAGAYRADAARQQNRHTLLRGIAIGACAGALAAAVAAGVAGGAVTVAHQTTVVPGNVNWQYVPPPPPPPPQPPG